LVAEGRSPAQEKQREKRRVSVAQNFGAVGKGWFKKARMAESTRSMRKAIFDRDILPVWENRLLSEITSSDLRSLCGIVKDRGAPATAIHVRDIVKQIYAFAILHGEKVSNPADDVDPASIATFAPNPTFSTGGLSGPGSPKNRAFCPKGLHYILRCGVGGYVAFGGDAWRRLRGQGEIELMHEDVLVGGQLGVTA
jgi:hypothetical protein